MPIVTSFSETRMPCYLVDIAQGGDGFLAGQILAVKEAIRISVLVSLANRRLGDS